MTDLLSMPTLGKTDSGGEIKMRRPLRERDGMVAAEMVLCYLPHNDVTPYVTWQRNTHQYISTYWGHYFKADEVEAAIRDFNERGN